MQKFQSELIGVFFLTLTVGLTSSPIAIGLVLGALVYLFSDSSGAHLNPAISLACWAKDEMNSRMLLSYLMAQTCGAVLAVMFLWWFTSATYAPAPETSVSTLQFISLEFILSMFFVLVYLGMMYPPKRRKNPAYGIVIGLAFAACYMITIPITDTGLNPVMSVIFIIADTVNNGYSYYYLPVYLIAPLLGALAAAFIYGKTINPGEAQS
ncbi:MAG: aquaporin [Balneolaceae bacterium]|nr:aquaporin [Balneolaceae bacterium]